MPTSPKITSIKGIADIPRVLGTNSNHILVALVGYQVIRLVVLTVIMSQIGSRSVLYLRRMEYYPLMGQSCCCRVPFQDLSQCRGNAWQLIVQSSSLLFLHHLLIVHAQCSLHEKSACFSLLSGMEQYLCYV